MPVQQSAHVGVIGLGPMGAALAQNMANNGNVVALFNRSYKKTAALVTAHPDTAFVPAKSMKSFVTSLRGPRKIMLMVKAGPAVDAVIKQLLPHLRKNDVIIDGGNSHYKDTQRRFLMLKQKGIHFIGCGVSGGEEGALKGPSLMPGGSKAGYRKVAKLLMAIAAKDFSGDPCVTYVGNNGAGHYVKMVHNGIEYAIMQLMAETYSLLRKTYKLSASDIAAIFDSYTRGKLSSYLFDIAVPVLQEEDEENKKNCCLIYSILDKASNKGTGKWASIDALERGIAVPSITQAVYARYISTEKDVRVQLNDQFPHKHSKPHIDKDAFVTLLEDALYAAIISAFAQGFDLLQKAATQEKWDIDLAEVARIWEGGCIIRAKLLKTIHAAFEETQSHLFLLPAVQKKMKRHSKQLRQLVTIASDTAIAIPGFASSLFYYESMIEDRLPANLIQGLRDYFGAHTYERNDKPGTFHTTW